MAIVLREVAWERKARQSKARLFFTVPPLTVIHLQLETQRHSV